MEDLFVWYIHHTYFWASLKGAQIDLPGLLGAIQLCLIASGVIFYIIHLVMPYDPVQKLMDPTLKNAPPPKILLSFSKGQLVRYVMSTIGVPFTIFLLFPYPQSWPTSDIIQRVFWFLGVVFFAIGAGILEHWIDRERMHK